jgi:hypothetical protein
VNVAAWMFVSLAAHSIGKSSGSSLQSTYSSARARRDGETSTS